jgi:hypothetical protein
LEVVALTMFVSLCLVACSLLLLAFTLRHRSHEHADRLALLPMEEDSPPSLADAAPTGPARKTEK